MKHSCLNSNFRGTFNRETRNETRDRTLMHIPLVLSQVWTASRQEIHSIGDAELSNSTFCWELAITKSLDPSERLLRIRFRIWCACRHKSVSLGIYRPLGTLVSIVIWTTIRMQFRKTWRRRLDVFTTLSRLYQNAENAWECFMQFPDISHTRRCPKVLLHHWVGRTSLGLNSFVICNL